MDGTGEVLEIDIRICLKSSLPCRINFEACIMFCIILRLSLTPMKSHPTMIVDSPKNIKNTLFGVGQPEI